MTLPVWVLATVACLAGAVCGAGAGTVYVRHLRWRRKRRSCPPEVVEGLEALLARFPSEWQYIEDMRLYAVIGRDRANLTMEYVEMVERQCERFAEQERQWEAAGMGRRA